MRASFPSTIAEPRIWPTLQIVQERLYAGKSPYEGYEKVIVPGGDYALNSILLKNQLTSLIVDHFGGKGPKFMLEVGSFVGAGATGVFGPIVKASGGLLLCIDTWEGAGDLRLDLKFRELMKVEHGMPNLYKIWMTRVIEAGLIENVFPLTLPSIVGFRVLERLAWKVDAIYLDASHDQGETYVELQLYYDILEPGGIIFGDDFEFYPGVKHDVLQFAKCNGLKVDTHLHNTFVIKKPSALPSK